MIGKKMFKLTVAAMLLVFLAVPALAAEKSIELTIPGCMD